MWSLDSLDGKKVIVTGGSRGIGASCVKVLCKAGALVGFTYLKSDEKADSIAASLKGRAVPYKTDTSDKGSMKDMVKDFSGTGDPEKIHGLVVNAGIYERRKFGDMTLNDWEHTMAVNLTGSFIAIKEVLPYMDEGSIVLISSQLAFKGSSSGADYCASKSGMLGMSRSLSRELAPKVRVNTVSPGYIATDILSGDSPEKRASRIEQVPMGRIGDPFDVAKAVLFLISDMSSYMTGSNLDVNGGLYIH